MDRVRRNARPGGGGLDDGPRRDQSEIRHVPPDVVDASWRLDLPVVQEGHAERLRPRPLDAHGSVDPRPEAGAARVAEGVVREVVAAGVGDPPVDLDDLAVVAHIQPFEEGAHGVHRQRAHDLDARRAKQRAPRRAQERLAAHRVEQHPALDPSARGALDGVGDLQRAPVRLPDVEQQVGVVGGRVEVGDDRVEERVGVVQQRDAIAGERRQAGVRRGQAAQRLVGVARRGPVLRALTPEPGGPLLDVAPGVEVTPRALRAHTRLADEQVHDRADHRREEQQHQPRQRDRDGPAAHHHAERQRQPDRPVRRQNRDGQPRFHRAHHPTLPARRPFPPRATPSRPGGRPWPGP